MKTLNENFEQFHSAKKSERGDPLGFFNIHSVAKYQQNEGGPFEDIKKFSQKSYKAEKGVSLIVPKKVERVILLLRNACKKISAYALV